MYVFVRRIHRWPTLQPTLARSTPHLHLQQPICPIHSSPRQVRNYPRLLIRSSALIIMDPSSPPEHPTRGSPSANAPGASSTTLSHRPAPGGRQGQSSESASQNTGSAPIPDDEHGADLPLNMTASVMLTSLPRDAHQALADVEAIDTGKGKLRSASTVMKMHLFSLGFLFIPADFIHSMTVVLTPRQSRSAFSLCHQRQYSRIVCSKSAPRRNLRR